MAKKKKHRKSRRQRLAKAQKQQQSAVEATTKSEPIAAKSQRPSEDIQLKKELATSQETEMEGYVKRDITRSLILIGIILVVFVILFVLLEKTPVGTQVHQLIKL